MSELIDAVMLYVCPLQSVIRILSLEVFLDGFGSDWSSSLLKVTDIDENFSLHRFVRVSKYM